MMINTNYFNKGMQKRGIYHQFSGRRHWSVALIIGILCLVPGVSFAMTYDAGSLIFQTEDQSMWSSGEAFILEEELFVGTEWDLGPVTIGGIIGGVTTETVVTAEWALWAAAHGDYLLSCESWFGCQDWLLKWPEPTKWTTISIDTRTGGEATASTYGKAGFEVGVKMDSGSVDATTSYTASLDIPDTLNVNEYFALNATSDFFGVQNLSTNFSEISAWLNLVLEAKADLSATACFLGAGCASGSTTIGFDEQTFELLSFNDTDSPGQIKIFDVLDPSLFQFDSPIDIPPNNPAVNFGNITFHVPDINTSTDELDSNDRLSSSGEDDLLGLKVDLDGVVLFAAGLPSSVLEGSVSAGPLDVGYNLVDVEVGPIIDLEQEFWLETMLMADLTFSSPVLIDGLEVTSLITPWNDIPEIALLDTNPVTVMPEFYIDALLHNTTRLGLDGEFTIDALTANFSIDAGIGSLDIGEIGLGRIVDGRDDLLDSPALFDSEFTLGGFNRIVGDTFLLQAQLGPGPGPGNEPIPEPGTMLLLSIGLIGLVGLRRTLKK